MSRVLVRCAKFSFSWKDTSLSMCLIRDITPPSAAYFADDWPTEFLVGTGLVLACGCRRFSTASC
jgi:hypothetical protein